MLNRRDTIRHRGKLLEVGSQGQTFLAFFYICGLADVRPLFIGCDIICTLLDAVLYIEAIVSLVREERGIIASHF